MTLVRVLSLVAVLVSTLHLVESCQVKGTGCSKTLACCAGLKCDLTSTGWGFCNPGSGSAPAPAPVPAPKPPPAPAPGPTPSGALITEAEFKSALTSNTYPSPRSDQYQNFVKYAGSTGGITTKQELAMILANVIHETGGLQQLRELNPPISYRAGDPGSWERCAVEDWPGQKYFGRGYIQLSWSPNYADASQAIFGTKDTLRKDPDMVARDDSVAWRAAFVFWKQNVRGKPGVAQGQFGATIKAVNGMECSGGSAAAAHRKAVYTKIFSLWKLSGSPNLAGC